MHDKWILGYFYLHGRHLYAISMNLAVSGHGSLFIVRDDAKNLQCLFFWHASTTICNSVYWNETDTNENEFKKCIYQFIQLARNKKKRRGHE